MRWLICRRSLSQLNQREVVDRHCDLIKVYISSRVTTSELIFSLQLEAKSRTLLVKENEVRKVWVNWGGLMIKKNFLYLVSPESNLWVRTSWSFKVRERDQKSSMCPRRKRLVLLDQPCLGQAPGTFSLFFSPLPHVVVGSMPHTFLWQNPLDSYWQSVLNALTWNYLFSQIINAAFRLNLPAQFLLCFCHCSLSSQWQQGSVTLTSLSAATQQEEIFNNK